MTDNVCARCIVVQTLSVRATSSSIRTRILFFFSSLSVPARRVFASFAAHSIAQCQRTPCRRRGRPIQVGSTPIDRRLSRIGTSRPYHVYTSPPRALGLRLCRAQRGGMSTSAPVDWATLSAQLGDDRAGWIYRYQGSHVAGEGHAHAAQAAMSRRPRCRSFSAASPGTGSARRCSHARRSLFTVLRC